MMRSLVRLFLLLAAIFGGGLLLIRLLYDVSWRGSLETS